MDESLGSICRALANMRTALSVTSPQGNGRSLLGPADFFAIRNFLGLRTKTKIDVHC